MTATLNGSLCSEVRLTMPRYGWPTAWATLATTDAPAVSAIPGACTLVVAGLELTCTAIYQGAPGGTRTVELVGGFGGWRRACRPQGYRADNLVSLSDYADDLARAAGELVTLAPGVDRKLAGVVARLGQVEAGALLSQACAAPAGAPVVPWWVDLDGTTRLGPRVGSAVTYQVADSDPLGRAYVFEQEDARPLLPGATVDGATIEELRLEASGSNVRELVTLALPGEDPRTFHGAMRRLMLAVFGPYVSDRTVYRYTVREVYSDGRIRAVPVRSLLAPDLRGLQVWPGIAGGRCKPRVGSQVHVMFADGDPCASSACVVNFVPATAGSNGIPERAELDADLVRLGSSATAPFVARIGDGGVGGTLTIVQAGPAVSISYVSPAGAAQVWTLTGTGLAVAGVPGNSATIGTEITEGSSKVQAG